MERIRIDALAIGPRALATASSTLQPRSRLEDPSKKLSYGFMLAMSMASGAALAQASSGTVPPQPSVPASSSTTATQVIFRLAKQTLPSGDVQLSGGKTVNVGDWPALLLARIPLTTGLASCTATLVGPTVMLTAAHCVDDPFGPKARELYLMVDNKKLKFDCEISPDYIRHDPQIMSPRGSEDYALCIAKVSGSIPETLAALEPEVVAVSQPLQQGENILMVGYGCTDLKVVNGEFTYKPSDKALRIGDEKIEKSQEYDAAYPAYSRTRSAGGKEPALCPGDSGGPVFSGASTDKPTAQRRVRAVNSAISSEKAGTGYDILSLISSTSTSSFETWARRWLAKQAPSKPIICGINKQAGDFPCRQ